MNRTGEAMAGRSERRKVTPVKAKEQQTMNRASVLNLLLLAAAALLIPLALACGGGDEGDSAMKDEPGAGATGRDAVGDQILTALVVADAVESAGFHDMAEDLATAAEINPRFAATVKNVIATLGAGVYPNELKAALEELRELERALKAGDKTAAAEAAEMLHDVEHEFTEATYAWLAGQAGKLSGAEDTLLSLLAVIDLADGVGFHGLAGTLAKATEVNPKDAESVSNFVVALRAASWPDTVKSQHAKFVTDIEALKTALTGKNLAAAQAAAEAAHDSEHELSEAFFAWMAKQARMTHAARSAHANLCNLEAVDIIAGAEFHDMAEALATAREVNPRFAETVGNVLAVMGVMSWPAGSPDPNALLHAMEELHEALEAGDIQAAQAAAEEVHDTEHDFSEGMFAMMGSSHMGGQ